MRSGALGWMCVMAGCMTGEPTGSQEVAVVEGEWVMAPGLSQGPMLADEVPAGVGATPVDLWILDGRVVVCPREVPMDGTVGGDDGADDDARGPATATGSIGRAADSLGGGAWSGTSNVREDMPWLRDASIPKWDVTLYG